MELFSQLVNLSAVKMQALILIMARLGGMFLDAPVFNSVNIHILIKTGLVIFISLVVLPFVPVDNLIVYSQPWLLFGAIVKEIMVGLVFGFAARLLFVGIQIAGQLIDYQMGFGFVNIVDPESRIQIPIMGQFMFILTILIFLLMNGHHWLLQSLIKSFSIVPLAGFSFQSGLVPVLNKLFLGIFVFAFKIAAPLMVSLFLVDVVYGVIGRSVPQANILVVGFPLKIGLGLLFFTYTLPLFFMVMQRLFSELNVQLNQLFKLM